MRQYNLHCNYCGADKYVNWFMLHLRLLINGKIYDRCNQCGYLSSYRLVGHIVHDTTDTDEKRVNKLLKDNLYELYKNG